MQSVVRLLVGPSELVEPPALFTKASRGENTPLPRLFGLLACATKAGGSTDFEGTASSMGSC